MIEQPVVLSPFMLKQRVVYAIYFQTQNLPTGKRTKIS